MSTAPSMPASAPGYLLPASAHGLLCDVGEVLRRLAARAAVEQASDGPMHLLSSQFGVLPQALRRLSACADVTLQRCAASRITHHHAEAS
ncbi:hypothetical protein [Xanthomonas citri]|uniref:hypothetical protein n=1 Tax=Xanthomonas citri TaxID=346 RepID=UPI000528E7DA|nr:hypothetical protein [Xanthomonas citri]